MKKIKNLIIDNYKWILVYIVTFIILAFPLPYFIEMPGGLIDVSKRIKIEDSNEVKGSINLAYVSTTKANAVNLVMSLILDDWDLVKKEEIAASNESIEDANYRNKISLTEANQTAILLAYKKANKKVNIKSSKLYVTYIHELADTNLKVGDEIVSINGVDVSTKDDVMKIINNLDFDTKIDIEVLNNSKQYIREAKVINYQDTKILGIILSVISDFDVEPDIELDFKNSESGASGGLMMSLAIYNYLTEYDLTKGRIIAGTGTIDDSGRVGEIDGVKYKIMGAVKKKADIFFVPKENYKEAIKVKKEKNYNIDIVKVETLDEAINYLKSN